MKQILCIGQSTYDITYTVEGYPKENSKVKAGSMSYMPGGSAGNMAYLLAKYGQEVSYMGTFGTDGYGKRIMKDFIDIGVDLKNCVIKDEYNTPIFTIINNIKNGSRTIVGYRKQNVLPSGFKMQYDSNPEIIVMDGYELEIARKVLHEFPNALSIVDAGSYKDEFIELGKYVTYFICSEDFAKGATGLTEITEMDFPKVFSELEKINKNTIVVTLGERGCLYKDGDIIKRLPAYKTKVIDTTAAGDIFHGAFAYGLSVGRSFIDCLTFASACAAVSVTEVGGRTAIPEYKEVYDMIEKNELLP